MNKEPWYKRWWPALLAFFVGVIAAIAAVATRAGKAKASVEEDQAQRQKALEQGLSAVDKTKQAQIAAADAQQQQAESAAAAQHEANNAAIEFKAQQDANAVAPADAPAALLGSLKSARESLKS
jgi:hypothetical protein